MRLIPDDRQVYVSARIWHEIAHKIDLAPFIHALHDGVDLTQYGDGLRKYYFTFLILDPGNRLHFPGTYFNRKKREAEVAVVVDYDRALAAPQDELIDMMEAAYLEGIDQLKTLPLKNFDVDAFKKDVAAIFAQERWYELAAAS